jgi:hypothetical protein
MSLTKRRASFACPVLLTLSFFCVQFANYAQTATDSTLNRISANPYGYSFQPQLADESTNDFPVPKKEVEDFIARFTGGYLRSVNQNYNGMVEGDLTLGLAAKHYAFSVVAGAGAIDLKGGTRAYAEAHDPAVLKLGLAFDYVFTKHHVLVQPYVTAGLDALCLAWDYREDVISGGNRVGFDYLGGFGYHGGIGLALRPNQNFALFAEITAGGMEFAETTTSDLNNDLFNTFTYVGVRGGLQLMW